MMLEGFMGLFMGMVLTALTPLYCCEAKIFSVRSNLGGQLVAKQEHP